ncbi:MAG: hypothetical protein NVS3B20_10920 [Polyangiales bacterium]
MLPVSWALLWAIVTSCAPQVPPHTSLRFAPTSRAPKTAFVTIDDQPVGSFNTIIERGVALPSGKHRITVESQGYLPWDAEVDAGDAGGIVNLDVKLVPIPD